MTAAIAVLASGGLDSAILVGDSLRQGRDVHPIYVRFGLAWEAVEEAHLRRFLDELPSPSPRPLVTLELPIADVYGSHWSVSGADVPDAQTNDDAVYLPGRNLLLLAKSSVWCALNGVHTIALGTLKGNPFSDASRDFFHLVGAMVTTAMDWPFDVVTPFAELDKTEVLERGRGLPLEHTFSCIDPRDGEHCGRCNKCEERRRAFEALHLDDATQYAAR